MNIQARKPLASILNKQSNFAKLCNRLRDCGCRIHRNQHGMESLQVVMILAIAAVTLQAIKYWWPWWKEYFDLAIEILLEN